MNFRNTPKRRKKHTLGPLNLSNTPNQLPQSYDSLVITGDDWRNETQLGSDAQVTFAMAELQGYNQPTSNGALGQFELDQMRKRNGGTDYQYSTGLYKEKRLGSDRPKLTSLSSYTPSNDKITRDRNPNSIGLLETQSAYHHLPETDIKPNVELDVPIYAPTREPMQFNEVVSLYDTVDKGIPSILHACYALNPIHDPRTENMERKSQWSVSRVSVPLNFRVDQVRFACQALYEYNPMVYNDPAILANRDNIDEMLQWIKNYCIRWETQFGSALFPAAYHYILSELEPVFAQVNLTEVSIYTTIIEQVIQRIQSMHMQQIDAYLLLVMLPNIYPTSLVYNDYKAMVLNLWEYVKHPPVKLQMHLSHLTKPDTIPVGVGQSYWKNLDGENIPLNNAPNIQTVRLPPGFNPLRYGEPPKAATPLGKRIEKLVGKKPVDAKPPIKKESQVKNEHSDDDDESVLIGDFFDDDDMELDEKSDLSPTYDRLDGDDAVSQSPSESEASDEMPPLEDKPPSNNRRDDTPPPQNQQPPRRKRNTVQATDFITEDPTNDEHKQFMTWCYDEFGDYPDKIPINSKALFTLVYRWASQRQIQLPLTHASLYPFSRFFRAINDHMRHYKFFDDSDSDDIVNTFPDNDDDDPQYGGGDPIQVKYDNPFEELEFDVDANNNVLIPPPDVQKVLQRNYMGSHLLQAVDSLSTHNQLLKHWKYLATLFDGYKSSDAFRYSEDDFKSIYTDLTTARNTLPDLYKGYGKLIADYTDSLSTNDKQLQDRTLQAMVARDADIRTQRDLLTRVEQRLQDMTNTLVNQLNVRITESNRTIQQLQDKSNELDADARDQALQKAKSEHEKLQSQYDLLYKAHKTSKELLDAQGERLDRQGQKIDTLENKLEQANTNLQNQKKEAQTRIATQTNNHKAEIAKLEETLDDLRNQIASNKQRIKELSVDNATTQNELDDLRYENNRLEGLYNDEQKKYTKAVKLHDEQRALINKLQKNNNEGNKIVDDLNRQINDQNQQIEYYKELADRYLDKINELNGEFEQLKKGKQDADTAQRIQAMKDTLIELSAQHQEAKSKLEEYEQRSHTLNEQLQQQQRENQHQSAHIQYLTHEIQTYAQNYEAGTLQYQALYEYASQLANTNTYLTTGLEQLGITRGENNELVNPYLAQNAYLANQTHALANQIAALQQQLAQNAQRLNDQPFNIMDQYQGYINILNEISNNLRSPNLSNNHLKPLAAQIHQNLQTHLNNFQEGIRAFQQNGNFDISQFMALFHQVQSENTQLTLLRQLDDTLPQHPAVDIEGLIQDQMQNQQRHLEKQFGKTHKLLNTMVSQMGDLADQSQDITRLLQILKEQNKEILQYSIDTKEKLDTLNTLVTKMDQTHTKLQQNHQAKLDQLQGYLERINDEMRKKEEEYNETHERLQKLEARTLNIKPNNDRARKNAEKAKKEIPTQRRVVADIYHKHNELKITRAYVEKQIENTKRNKSIEDTEYQDFRKEASDGKLGTEKPYRYQLLRNFTYDPELQTTAKDTIRKVTQITDRSNAADIPIVSNTQRTKERMLFAQRYTGEIRKPERSSVTKPVRRFIVNPARSTSRNNQDEKVQPELDMNVSQPKGVVVDPKVLNAVNTIDADTIDTLAGAAYTLELTLDDLIPLRKHVQQSKDSRSELIYEEDSYNPFEDWLNPQQAY